MRQKSKFHVPAPTRQTIYDIHRKFVETCSVKHAKGAGRPRSGRSLENVAMVQEMTNDDPSSSVRKVSAELGLSKDTVHRIRRLDLKFKPFKIQMVHQLLLGDYARRTQMCETLLEMIRQDPEFLGQLSFSDESTFHLSGHVNTQNCRIWGAENNHDFLEHERDSPKVNVWCLMTRQQIIGPFFFLEKTVTQANYLDMLQQFLSPQLEEAHLTDSIWFMQDGAPPHYAHIVRDWLNLTFPNRWIGRGGFIEWAPRSPDLTPCDFFLWGKVKSDVYVTKPANLAELRNRIRASIESITPDMLEMVFDNVVDRFEKCIEYNGEHIEPFL